MLFTGSQVLSKTFGATSMGCNFKNRRCISELVGVQICLKEIGYDGIQIRALLYDINFSASKRGKLEEHKVRSI
jgi:hypothetical protein